MRLLSILGLGLAIAAQSVAQQASGDWSASLLERMLGAGSTPTSAGSGVSQSTAMPQEGMIVRIYQLRFGKVGSPEFDTKLTVLERLVPSGSIIKKDIPANSISVLTTPIVQEAVYTFVSAIDTPPAPTTAEIPPAVQQALSKLAESNTESAKLLATIGALRTEIRSDVSKQLDAMANKTHNQLLYYGLGGLGVAVCFALVLLLQRRKEEQSRTHALALAPRANQMLVEQVRSGQEMARDEIRNMLTTVAQRMQQDRAQLQQQVVDGQLMLADMKVQMTELAADRERVLNRAENMLKGAVEKFENNTSVLQSEQGRVREIAQELQRTLTELDGTRDRLQAEQVEAQRVRFALEKERAKVAALSLLLEDGEIPSAEAMAPSADEPILPAPMRDIEQPSQELPAAPVAVVATEADAQETHVAKPRLGFTFLPPDAPDVFDPQQA